MINLINRYKRGKRLRFLKRIKPFVGNDFTTLSKGDKLWIRKTNATVDYIALSCGIAHVDEADAWQCFKIIRVTDNWFRADNVKTGSTIFINSVAYNENIGLSYKRFNLWHLPSGFMRDEMYFRFYVEK